MGSQTPQGHSDPLLKRDFHPQLCRAHHLDRGFFRTRPVYLEKLFNPDPATQAIDLELRPVPRVNPDRVLWSSRRPLHADLGASRHRYSLCSPAMDGRSDWRFGGYRRAYRCLDALHRRLADPRIRATSSWPDIIITALIWVQLVTGLLTITQTLQHMDGGKIVLFMGWSHSVLFAYNLPEVDAEDAAPFTCNRSESTCTL